MGLVAETVARALYRDLMGDDYSDFPWDDDNVPSNETEQEARHFGEVAEQVLVSLGNAITNEQEYMRLSTMGKLDLGKSVLEELITALDMAGFPTAKRTMQEAWRTADDTWNELSDQRKVGE